MSSSSEYFPSSDEESSSESVHNLGDCDSLVNNNDVEVTKGKRKIRKECEWRRNERKFKRNKGLSYVGTSGKVVREKKIGPRCTCSSKCFEKVGGNVDKIFSNFLQMGDFSVQNAYIAGCVKMFTPKRVYKKDGPSRKVTACPIMSVVI